MSLRRQGGRVPGAKVVLTSIGPIGASRSRRLKTSLTEVFWNVVLRLGMTIGLVTARLLQTGSRGESQEVADYGDRWLPSASFVLASFGGGKYMESACRARSSSLATSQH